MILYMKKALHHHFFLALLITLVIGACNNDDGGIQNINVTVDSVIVDSIIVDSVVIYASGNVELTFTSGDQPVANTPIRVNAFSSNFDMGNIFEGQTDANGVVTMGPLHPGHYMFELDPVANGVLVETFQVLAESDTEMSFDLEDYGSMVTFETGFPQFVTASYLLIPDQVTYDNKIPISQRLEQSHIANVSNGTLVFPNVLPGYYDLVYYVDNDGIQNFGYVTNAQSIKAYDQTIDNNDFHYEVLNSLNGLNWSAVETTTIISAVNDGTPVANLIQSVSIEFPSFYINFENGASHESSYYGDIYEHQEDGSIVIELEIIEEYFLEAYTLTSNVAIHENGQMIIEYYNDNDGLEYEATLELQ